MRSWPAPTVPTLTQCAPEVVLRDRRTGIGAVVAPEGPARVYVCGITPYDATHLGHAATYLMVDTLRRALQAAGHETVLAENVTDVDEPLLERAARDGVDWTELAQRETQLFRDDMAWLRVLPPEHFCGVVESMDLVVRYVASLVEAGVTYQVPAPDAVAPGASDIYLDLARTSGFGDVSRYDRDAMLAVFAERGGDPERPGKRDPLDPLLWRAERAGEPAYEAGDLGRGRPGWHIECTALAVEHLGGRIDVQAGGTDLVFPHHEMSAVQAAALPGHEVFAQRYLHQAMVGLDGEKMSKSKGNLVLASRLRAQGADAAAVRAAMLDHHYATEWSWTDEDLTRATERVRRWRDAAARGTEAPAAIVEHVLVKVADDLDTPGALRCLDAWASGVVEVDESGEAPVPAATVVDLADALLGLDLRP